MRRLAVPERHPWSTDSGGRRAAHLRSFMQGALMPRNKEPLMNRRVVLFARVSTDDRGQTTESQLLALRAVAARVGGEIVAEVALELSAWTAKTAADVRRKALAAVRDHRADLLAVWA